MTCLICTMKRAEKIGTTASQICHCSLRVPCLNIVQSLRIGRTLGACLVQRASGRTLSLQAKLSEKRVRRARSHKDDYVWSYFKDGSRQKDAQIMAAFGVPIAARNRTMMGSVAWLSCNIRKTPVRVWSLWQAFQRFESPAITLSALTLASSVH